MASLKEEFATIISRITSYSYPTSIRRTEYENLNRYINSKEFCQFWHGRLGNTVSNWYFFQHGRKPELLRFHKHKLCTLNPSWAANLKPVLGEQFQFCWKDWDIVRNEEEKKSFIQGRIDISLDESMDFSIHIIKELLRAGDIWRSESEKKAGWICIELGEILIYCFEERLLTKLKEFNTFTKAIENEKILNTMAENAWREVIEWHGGEDDEETLIAIVNTWINNVLANRDGEYDDWYNKSFKDWFILGKESRLFRTVTEGISYKDWALAICKYSSFDNSSDSLNNYNKRVRFSPKAERLYKTRNLVVFPLWMEESFTDSRYMSIKAEDKTNQKKTLNMITPYTAYFVATFYDSAILKNENGGLVRTLLSVMAYPDIIRFSGEAVALNKQIEESQIYAAGLYHDLIPRIIGIEVLLDSLASCDVLQDKIIKNAQEAARDIFLIKKLARDFRDYSRGQELSNKLELERVSLWEIIKDSAKYFDKMRVESDISSNLFVNGDKDRLLRLFLNVLTNAEESMYDRQNKYVRVETTEHADSICVDVSDNGDGIPQESWGSVFEPYYTTKEGKTRGIGLALCKLIIDAHKKKTGTGSIVVQQSSKCGTTFRIELPRAH